MNNDHFQSQFDDSSESTLHPITLLSTLFAVLKRPWIILLSCLFVLIPLSYYLLNLSTVYRSSATVMVSVGGSTFMDAFSIVGGSRPEVKSERYYTSILDSRIYRDDVAKQLGSSYPHLPKDSLARIVGGGIGYSTKVREPGFIKIYAKSESKIFALTLAEAALEQFKTRSISLQREDAFHVSEFINNQVDGISVKLEKAAGDLLSFMTAKKLTMVGIETGITQELFDLESSYSESKAKLELVNINIISYNQQMDEILNKLTETKREVDEEEIINLKDRLNKIRNSLENSESLNLTPIDIQALTLERDRVRNNLIELVTTSTPTEGEGIFIATISMQKLEDELEVSVLKRTAFENQVLFYKLQIDRFRFDHPNLSEDILAFASLNRTKAILQKTLDILLEKREEIRIRVESELGGIKVIDSPRRPGGPISTQKTKKLIYGILVALGLGLTLSVVVDRLDDSIKDESDIFGNTGLSVFGTIPALDTDAQRGPKYGHYERKRKTKPAAAVDNSAQVDNIAQNDLSRKLLKNFSEKSPTAESYRSLKIALEFIAIDKSKKMFTISSSSASEGKSLTTANLATSFAQGGKRTLIIDCDLRKSVQHKYFGVDRKPGLTNYLFGEQDLENIVAETPVPGLFLISAGTSPSNPAELLDSHKMKELLGIVRDQYDYILIDTPPILICSDSRVLSKTSDGMIVLVKVESTTVKALKHSISLTQHLDIEIVGVIMNQVRFRYGRAYYYTYRYYKPYSYYGGYYYNRMYYDYTEGDDGEKSKAKKQI